jgi:hypothetical protein
MSEAQPIPATTPPMQKRSIGGEKLDTSGPRDNKEHWVFFDDRVGMKKSMNYVTGCEKNQRNCYMALYELVETKATKEERIPYRERYHPFSLRSRA